MNVAHAIINGDRKLGIDRPITAGTTATVSPGERAAYDSSRAAVAMARIDEKVGLDPTRGAINFNERANASTGPFLGLPLTTQAGPFANSFPTKALPATGIYVNTYGKIVTK